MMFESIFSVVARNLIYFNYFTFCSQLLFFIGFFCFSFLFTDGGFCGEPQREPFGGFHFYCRQMIQFFFPRPATLTDKFFFLPSSPSAFLMEFFLIYLLCCFLLLLKTIAKLENRLQKTSKLLVQLYGSS